VFSQSTISYVFKVFTQCLVSNSRKSILAIDERSTYITFIQHRLKLIVHASAILPYLHPYIFTIQQGLPATTFLQNLQGLMNCKLIPTNSFQLFFKDMIQYQAYSQKRLVLFDYKKVFIVDNKSNPLHADITGCKAHITAE